jgi:hypothetical protein
VFYNNAIPPQGQYVRQVPRHVLITEYGNYQRLLDIPHMFWGNAFAFWEPIFYAKENIFMELI